MGRIRDSRSFRWIRICLSPRRYAGRRPAAIWRRIVLVDTRHSCAASCRVMASFTTSSSTAVLLLPRCRGGHRCDDPRLDGAGRWPTRGPRPLAGQRSRSPFLPPWSGGPGRARFGRDRRSVLVQVASLTSSCLDQAMGQGRHVSRRPGKSACGRPCGRGSSGQVSSIGHANWARGAIYRVMRLLTWANAVGDTGFEYPPRSLRNIIIARVFHDFGDAQ